MITFAAFSWLLGEYGVPARRLVQESENWKNQVGPENAATYLASLDGRRILDQVNPTA